jgi:hypothetical protein
MANETVVQAGQNAGIGIDPMVIIAVAGITGIIGVAVYLFFNDHEYNLMTRFIAYTGKKIRAEDEKRGLDKEEVMQDLEEVAEENEEVNSDPEELFNTVEAISENKEYIGRQEERKKQRKDENLKDILTIVLITSGINLLLRLFEMFA